MTKDVVKKYMLTNANQEAHFPAGNNTVAVCWNIHQVAKSIKGPGDVTYKADVWVRRPNSKPYIDFVSVREYNKGEFVKDEDSPVAGGQSIQTATRLAEELLRAVEYAKSQGAK
jgi:hypothetical protein